MSTYSRRTFLKHSAMLTAAAAASRLFPASLIGSPHQSTQQGSGSSFFARAKSPDVIAHRGGDDERPGETMYAYKHAVEIGADVLEMDVYRTRDNHLVLMHNMTVNETTNGTGFVNLMRLEKLKRLNAGFHWNKGDDQKLFFNKPLDEVPEPLRDDLRVPTLEEVFKAFPHMRMNIEMKPAALPPVKELCQMIQELHMEENVLVASFSHLYLMKFRRLCPDVPTSASVAELINYKLFNKRPKASVIQVTPDIELEIKKRMLRREFRIRKLKIELPFLTPEFVKKAHSDGLKVHAWTINDKAEMKRIKELGVDGIITDKPTDLISLSQ